MGEPFIIPTVRFPSLFCSEVATVRSRGFTDRDPNSEPFSSPFWFIVSEVRFKLL